MRIAKTAAFAALVMILGSTAALAKSFVIPHILEKEGTITNTQFTFDTTLFMTYTPGLAGVPTPHGRRDASASVDLFLYDEDGSPMRAGQPGAGGDVCNPCSFPIGGSAGRKVSVRIDDLIVARGGFDQQVKLGFGIIVVGGADPDGVNLQGFVTNAHTGPFDLSVFGFEPQPIAAAP